MAQNYPPKLSLDNIKLAALWAVSECGLGGILHAFKMPFSGVLLASFAVMIISLIARNNQHVFKDVLQITALVLVVKFTISPHAPITAFLAVAFQGILGAIVYSFGRIKLLHHLIFSTIALMESALQKIFLLIFILNVQSFQEFKSTVLSEIDFLSNKLVYNIPEILLMLYLGIYLFVGIWVAFFAHRLPINIENEIANWKKEYESFRDQNLENIPVKKNRNTSKALQIVLVIALSILVFTVQIPWLKSLLKTFLVIGLFILVVQPLLMFFLQKLKGKVMQNHRLKLNDMMQLMPSFRQNALLSLHIAKKEKRPLAKLKKFIHFWLMLSLIKID